MSLRNRILIADDNKTDVELLKEHLSGLDYEISMATDGAETLNFVAQYQPNLILLNPKMGTISGHAICNRIKQNSANRKTMIMMIADLDEMCDIERAVEVGVDDFLSKPVNKSELLKRIEILLKLSHLQR